ncbi:hypothetical protein PILCRDRAFT_826227 [Piloderma croceum F 1598]|uniref:Uncharacterized protein n=1 Tax=Piloderma croceum (strain F 1598) TaxID=765440 RepID=A0A0C3AR82_PILCF|nr:hypothetical protein PILCRDRAFT_826227 [Piloderma croceum F 1598]
MIFHPSLSHYLHVRDSVRTALNRFGLLREYPRRPSYDPDASLRSKDFANWDTPRHEPAIPNSVEHSFCRHGRLKTSFDGVVTQ